MKSKGDSELQKTLSELYAYGNRTNWTIGLSSPSNANESPSKKKKNVFRGGGNMQYDRVDAILTGGLGEENAHLSSHSKTSLTGTIVETI